jgi:hypothetical protein
MNHLARTDLADRTDVEALLRRFHDRAGTTSRAREGSGRQDRLGEAPQAGHAKASGSGPNLKWRPVISDGVTRT